MENKDGNIFEQIRQVIGENKTENLNILEEQIDVSLQKKYLEFSKENSTEENEDTILERRQQLYDESASEHDIKVLLCQLASIPKVDAYRAIEAFVNYTEGPHLKEWATLALQESRMLLKSNLLDETQVFISTGLGGKNLKLRYFIVLIYKDPESVREVQKQVVQKEFPYILGAYNAEIEDISFDEEYVSITALIPMQVNVNDAIKEAIEECNVMGNFLNDSYIITNVKKFDREEILNHIYNKEDSDQLKSGDEIDETWYN